MKKLYSILGIVVAIAAFALFVSQAPSAHAPSSPPTPQNLLDAINNLRTELQDVPRSWSRKLPSAERFVLVLDGAAVLDRETGLVWERSPDGADRSWVSALAHCYTRHVGGRKGWRLPTIEELASLVDRSQFPTLPAGHPFDNVQFLITDIYWSATTNANNTAHAWGVNFQEGEVLAPLKVKVGQPVWCVRGGQGNDGFFHPLE